MSMTNFYLLIDSINPLFASKHYLITWFLTFQGNFISLCSVQTS